MNLAIDFGNTRVKAALFNGHQLVDVKFYQSINDLTDDTAFLKQSDKCIIASVVNNEQTITGVLNNIKTSIFFTSQTKVPIKNSYKTISTLGSDRLAASVGAYSLYPTKNILVIDAGTCLKFNFTNAKGEYSGGAISPGLQMRFKALQHFTDKLPLISFNENYDKLVGESTEESILSGVINGILNETDGIINEYKKLYSDLTIVITGGDTDFFAKRLKNRIFAHPHLVLTGLNEILIYNS
ncbi:MAG TPA: type III pantothenate kinase [Bacteroidia bacterium]|jgi:type III pantothenate kinase|nr:type III pantothenate kinase [Bacteroidia bacterium]